MGRSCRKTSVALSRARLPPQGALASVPPRRINEIVKGLRGITVDTALRLGAFFGADAQSWVNLQTYYDTERTRESMAEVIGRIHRFKKAQA